MGKKNFVNWARRHLASAGMDVQSGDPEAYYDPELTDSENRQLFKEHFPLPERAEVEYKEGLGERVQAYKERGDFKTDELSKEREAEGIYEIEELEKKEARDIASRLERQGYLTTRSMAEKKAKKDLLAEVEGVGYMRRKKGAIEKLKEKYKAFAAEHRENRAAKAKAKLQEYSKERYLQVMENRAEGLKQRVRKEQIRRVLSPFVSIAGKARTVSRALRSDRPGRRADIQNVPSKFESIGGGGIALLMNNSGHARREERSVIGNLMLSGGKGAFSSAASSREGGLKLSLGPGKLSLSGGKSKFNLGKLKL